MWRIARALYLCIVLCARDVGHIKYLGLSLDRALCLCIVFCVCVCLCIVLVMSGVLKQMLGRITRAL